MGIREHFVFLEAGVEIERGWGRQCIIEAWIHQVAVTACPIPGAQMLIDLQFSRPLQASHGGPGGEMNL